MVDGVVGKTQLIALQHAVMEQLFKQDCVISQNQNMVATSALEQEPNLSFASSNIVQEVGNVAYNSICNM